MTAELRSCLVVGTGLIGTSIALALRRKGVTVHLRDRDEVAVRRAADLGAGDPGAPVGRVDVAVVAVAPSATAEVAGRLLDEDVADTVVDTAGVKAAVLADVRRAAPGSARFVGTHPMAGRERSGPGAARADLFHGRPWVLVGSGAEPAAQARAAALVELCGGVVVPMEAVAHDVAVALVSHVPQVASSLVAAQLTDGPDDALALTGQGLRDVTRVAASDPDLWIDVLLANSRPVAHVLGQLAEDLAAVVDALYGQESDPAESRGALRELLVRGNAGRARLPGKHGAPPTSYAVVPVVVADRPGELARLFADAGDAGVNVEDIRIEHSPGQPVGLVELAVAPDVTGRLVAALRALGWVVHA